MIGLIRSGPASAAVATASADHASQAGSSVSRSSRRSRVGQRRGHSWCPRVSAMISSWSCSSPTAQSLDEALPAGRILGGPTDQSRRWCARTPPSCRLDASSVAQLLRNGDLALLVTRMGKLTGLTLTEPPLTELSRPALRFRMRAPPTRGDRMAAAATASCSSRTWLMPAPGADTATRRLAEFRLRRPSTSRSVSPTGRRVVDAFPRPAAGAQHRPRRPLSRRLPSLATRSRTASGSTTR